MKETWTGGALTWPAEEPWGRKTLQAPDASCDCGSIGPAGLPHRSGPCAGAGGIGEAVDETGWPADAVIGSRWRVGWLGEAAMPSTLPPTRRTHSASALACEDQESVICPSAFDLLYRRQRHRVKRRHENGEEHAEEWRGTDRCRNWRVCADGSPLVAAKLRPESVATSATRSALCLIDREASFGESELRLSGSVQHSAA